MKSTVPENQNSPSPVLGETALGVAVPIDPQRLIEGRLIVTGNSGSGKSRTLRRIIEQTYGRMQQIIFDPEDEFFTLREIFDYVLTGAEGADCPTSVATAGPLARKIMELNLSAVIGLADLDLEARLDFVQAFLHEIMWTKRRRPVLIVLDEADIYAPEKANHDCAKEVVNLCVRGRKRGLVPVLATNRPALLSKSASAPCVNKLIGRQSEDIDVERSAKVLGLRGADRSQLQHLRPGQFFALGPAFNLNEGKCVVNVGGVRSFHPEPGIEAPPPPPPRSEIARILATLADLVPAAIAEPASFDPQIRAADCEKARLRGVSDALDQILPMITGLEANAKQIQSQHVNELPAELRDWIESAPWRADAWMLAEGVLKLQGRIRELYAMPVPEREAIREFKKGDGIPERVSAPSAQSNNSLSTMELALLRAIVQRGNDGASKQHVSLMTGYSASGHVSKAFAAILARGLAKPMQVERTGTIHLFATPEGITAAGVFEPYPTGGKLYRQVIAGGRLDSMQTALLRAIGDSPGSKGHVLAKAGYSSSGHASKAFARLIRAGYVVRAGSILRLSEYL